MKLHNFQAAIHLARLECITSMSDDSGDGSTGDDSDSSSGSSSTDTDDVGGDSGSDDSRNSGSDDSSSDDSGSDDSGSDDSDGSSGDSGFEDFEVEVIENPRAHSEPPRTAHKAPSSPAAAAVPRSNSVPLTAAPGDLEVEVDEAHSSRGRGGQTRPWTMWSPVSPLHHKGLAIGSVVCCDKAQHKQWRTKISKGDWIRWYAEGIATGTYETVQVFQYLKCTHWPASIGGSPDNVKFGPVVKTSPNCTRRMLIAYKVGDKTPFGDEIGKGGFCKV